MTRKTVPPHGSQEDGSSAPTNGQDPEPSEGPAPENAAPGEAALEVATSEAAAPEATETDTASGGTAAEPPLTAELAASYEAAWATAPPEGDVWSPRPWVSLQERARVGKAARERVPRSSHATFEARADRDPIAILDAQETERLQHLLPLRHARMAASEFAYYRGTPAVMAYDLADTPSTGIIVQASGDAHLSNFGLFASPERTLVFDANDFDETLPAPWEWDVKRLAASMVVAGRENGFDAEDNRRAARDAVRGYREWMTRFAQMRLIDVWYAKITDDDIVAALEALPVGRGRTRAERRARLESIFSRARSRDQLRAFSKLTTIVEGRPVIVDDPPLVQHVELEGSVQELEQVFADYRASMAENRRDFLERFRFADFALKVVGVGSVGTRCWVVVLEGRDEADPLILQAKQATASVLEPYVDSVARSNHGERVVVGQRSMQATPDIFLGWTRGPRGWDYYFRQLWDMKGSVETAELRPPGLAFYGWICGWSLARAHARTGDAAAIAAYLGSADTFDAAVADFAEAYADVNARDFAAYREAIDAGRVSTTTEDAED